jgi:DNA repair protein RecN (Recombination protein N)
MLLSLLIENFALIDRLNLEFGAGLNVLTGETGAGKSIILDAIDAALGGKVSSRAIRTGSNRSMVEATFKLNRSLAAWLVEQEIELIDEETLVCSREMNASSGSLRSRTRVNGVLVNRQVITQLRSLLVEITAQGQTVQVGQPAQVRQWLDLYGGEAHFKEREIVAKLFADYQEAKTNLEKRRQCDRQRLQQLDLLKYQAQELGAASLSDPDEFESLEQESQRLSHVVELQQLSYKVYQAVYQNDNDGLAAADLLGNAEVVLTDMVQYDSQLQPLVEAISEALAAVGEVGRQIHVYGDALEADPQRLGEVEERIRELKQICRKYGPTLVEVLAYYDRVQTELAEIDGGEQSVEAMEQREQLCYAKLMQTVDKLTKLRQATAARMESKLLTELKPLAMDKVQFEVAIEPTTVSAMGGDRITFLFSANPGEPLQPLTEVASGGEMSRFLLALKSCFSSLDPVGTLIFDEIDVGVSGKVANAIAEKLHQLSDRQQVLCVTHQPLVAAMADRHFRVDKQALDDTNDTDVRTVVRVKALDNFSTRREELATLASGQSQTEAIAFADSLLTQAAHLRQGKLVK